MHVFGEIKAIVKQSEANKQASKQKCHYMNGTPFPQVQLSWEHFFLFGALVWGDFDQSMLKVHQ